MDSVGELFEEDISDKLNLTGEMAQNSFLPNIRRDICVRLFYSFLVEKVIESYMFSRKV